MTNPTTEMVKSLVDRKTKEKKLAAQFSKVAKIQHLTMLMRDTYGTSITRNQLKAFERVHKLVVQWVARREAPTQGFRTPLGFVRSGRGTYAIPSETVREEVLVNETGTPVTVTAPIDPPDAPAAVTAPVDVKPLSPATENRYLGRGV